MGNQGKLPPGDEDTDDVEPDAIEHHEAMARRRAAKALMSNPVVVLLDVGRRIGGVKPWSWPKKTVVTSKQLHGGDYRWDVVFADGTRCSMKITRDELVSMNAATVRELVIERLAAAVRGRVAN